MCNITIYQVGQAEKKQYQPSKNSKHIKNDLSAKDSWQTKKKNKTYIWNDDDDFKTNGTMATVTQSISKRNNTKTSKRKTTAEQKKTLKRSSKWRTDKQTGRQTSQLKISQQQQKQSAAT